MSPATAIRDIAASASRWLAVGGVGTGSVFSSTDKIEWVEMPFGFGECKAAICSAEKFYIAVDGEGIYKLDVDTWVLDYASAQTFTNGVDANGIPMFATDDGTLLTGPTWTSKKISDGVLHVACNSKLVVASLDGETLETFVGTTAQNLVSEGTSTLDDLNVFVLFADTKGGLFGAGKTNSGSPLMFVRKGTRWLFVFSSLPAPITHAVTNAVASGKQIYTTNDYVNYTPYHAVDKDITALLYA